MTDLNYLLVVVVVALSVGNFVLCCAVPFLWWELARQRRRARKRYNKCDAKIEVLDQALEVAFKKLGLAPLVQEEKQL